jgi:formylglycine-generating enzyme required for sulfatase activity
LAAPTKLAGAAILFCLPWTAIQCHYTLDNGTKHRDVVITQSGLQAAYGGWTASTPLEGYRHLRPPDPNQANQNEPRAPLMIVYGAAIVLGIVAGLLLRLGRFRRVVVGAAAMAAVGVLFLQARAGFPIADSIVAKANAAEVQRYDDQENDSLTRGPSVFVVHYTVWYYWSFALPLAALAIVVAEGFFYRDWRTSILFLGIAATLVLYGVYSRAVPNPLLTKGEDRGVTTGQAGKPKPAEGKQWETSLGSTLIYCPPGSFLMGSPAAEKHRFPNEGQVKVTISKGFYLGRYSVTQAEFKTVMGRTPWMGEQIDMVKKGDDYPATCINWKDAAEFCRKLTVRESQAGRLLQGYVYALPTEAQREYAARAGTTTAYSFGDDAANLGEYAWWRATVGGDDKMADLYPRRVGQKKPNPWDFYDMHGNVLEWCRDAYVEQLPGGTDPFVETAMCRVIRGGCWDVKARRCRSAFREGCVPQYRRENTGFRLALVPSSPSPAATAAKAVENRVVPDLPAGKSWKTLLGSILIECPAGSFTMGRAVAEKGRGFDEDQVSVKISKGFYLGRYPVTQAEFEAVMGKAPWFPGWRPKIGVDCVPADLAPGGRLSGVPAWRARIGDDCPATYVTWNGATEFCRKLTARDSQAGRLPQSYAYALPTEAQWEYACRAGTTTAYWFGDDAEKLAEYAWCNGRNDGIEPYAHPVGQKKPNPWGLYDMRGNVWEMCRDGCTQQLPGGTDPFVAPTGGWRARRGGTWDDPPVGFRSAKRDSYPYGPESPDARLGFRLALAPASAWDQTTVPKSAESQGVPNDPPAKVWETSLGSKLVYCPPGSFTMGSNGDWDGYGDAAVTISKRFFLGRYCVTQAEFKAVMGQTPWAGKEFVQEGDEYPATYVDWNDAAEFCRKLTARESKAGSLLPGYGYALPTEAQREYACRAGTTTAYSFGRDAQHLAEYAWYCGTIRCVNAQPELFARPVGQKKPNPWGFYDVHGNVLEWCRDAFAQTIPGGTDPFVKAGPYRTIRGGSWFGMDFSCRSSDRGAYGPSYRSDEQGFRLALVPLGK